MKIDHVGVVVKNTEESMGAFVNLFGFAVEEVQTFPDQGFKSTIAVKDAVRIEWIEPIGEKGIIQNFIKKNGYGLHHISLRVDNLERQIGVLDEKGAHLINKEPFAINDLSSISFLHPASAAGIFIEMIHRKTA